MNINLENIFEINVRINPWDNIYRIEFTLDRGYERVNADFYDIMELANIVKKLSSKLAIIRQYKYRDRGGFIQINEPMRLKHMGELKKDEE